MARRGRSVKKQRRRAVKAQIKILGLAEGLAIANLASNAIFDVNIAQFLGGKVGSKVGGVSQEITLKELMTAAMGGSGGWPSATGLMGTMQKNLQRTEWSEWIKLITIPIGFRVARKVLGKNVINPVNRILKNNLGVKEIKL